MRVRFLICFAAFALLGLGPCVAAYGQTAAPAQAGSDPWPRQRQISGGTMTVYQPQVDSWDDGFLKLRAAVAVKPTSGEKVFGIVRVSAHTLVDRATRMVTLFNISLLQIDFPTLPDHG